MRAQPTAGQGSQSPPRLPLLVPIARGLLAAGLRTLPHFFGERGRLHAEWRAHHWAPAWLHEDATDLRLRREHIRWRLDLRDNVQRSLYYTGHYEPTVQALLRRSLPPGGVLIDVGAHIGVHALPLARHLSRTGGRVFAFEPAPDNAEKLREAARRSQITNIDILATALGSRAGTTVLRANSSYGLHDTGVRSEFGDGPPLYEVPVVVFDDWAKEHRLDRADAVKIDVEGAELAVLQGMTQTFRQLRPRVVVVELLEVNQLAAGARSSDVPVFFEEIGYVRLPGLVDKNAVFLPAEHVA